MAFSATVEMKGLAAVQQKFKKLEAKVDGDALDRALYAGGLVIEGYAKINCERAGAVDTGFLMNSIFTKGHRISDETANKAAALQKAHRTTFASPTVEKRTVLVSVGALYGVYVEYGTHKMTARPFMRKAVDENYQDAVDAISDNLDGMIEGVWA